MIKDKENKTELEEAKVGEVGIKRDTIHKKGMMIKATMIKDATRIKTESMVTLQTKHLEVAKSTKLNTDVN